LKGRDGLEELSTMTTRYIPHSESSLTDLTIAKDATLEALLHNVQLVHRHHSDHTRTPSDRSASVYVGTPGGRSTTTSNANYSFTVKLMNK
jgi:hypothetical protein